MTRKNANTAQVADVAQVVTKVSKKAPKAPKMVGGLDVNLTGDPEEPVCAECGQHFTSAKEPRTKNEAGEAIHIRHRATGSTAPTKAKANKPCRYCTNEGVEKPTTDTFFTVGTRKGGDGERKQIMVNTYLCASHISSIDFYSGPRFVGRAPEMGTVDKAPEPQSVVEPKPTKKAVRKPKAN